MRYNEKIAAQVAAYFIYREGGLLNTMKLIKLMYLAERESLQQFGEPMMGDNLVSMPHGPVMSITLDHINGFIPSDDNGWDNWISDKADHFVSLKTDGDPTNNLLELSDSDFDVLNIVLDKFGSMDQYQLRDYTHNHCGEWEDPDGSVSTIPYNRLLKNVGYTPDAAIEINKRIEDQRSLNDILSYTG